MKTLFYIMNKLVSCYTLVAMRPENPPSMDLLKKCHLRENCRNLQNSCQETDNFTRMK